MRKLKITVIGAGSTYTPELIEGFILRKETLPLESIYLMDINEVKLNIIADLTERMLQKENIDCRLVRTTQLEEAIEGADYVLTQIRVGGLEARVRDERIPMKYGMLGQETTGVGGFMKAMRTLPVMMNIARLIEKTAPNAWLINFANPSGLIAEALLNFTNVKMIGLCNVPISMVKDASKLLEEPDAGFDYDYVGLNHLSWITAIYENGRDILPDRIKAGLRTTTMKNIEESEYEVELLRATGAIPSSYLNYFYFPEEKKKHNEEAEKTRGEVCMEIEKQLLELYKDVNLAQKPALLEERGGAYYSTAAVSLIDAIENDKKEIHVVNVRANGALDFMEPGDVVEIKCIVGKNGASPITTPCRNLYITGLMKAVKAYEKLAVKAGLEGDIDAALAALMVHPLIGDYAVAKPMLKEMLEANKDFLPQFFKAADKGNDVQ